MKSIVVIAYSKSTSLFYADQLQALFKDFVKVYPYDLEQMFTCPIQADVVLVSTHSVYELIENYLGDCHSMVIADLTLTKKAVDRLRMLPGGTKAMLVNSTVEMAVETISLIYNSGIHHVELTPVYPGILQIPPLQLAITPGECSIVPSEVKRVINLGDRVLSVRTIINLASKLELTALLPRPEMKDYFRSLAVNDAGVTDLINKLNAQWTKLELVMDIFEGVVISLARNGKISFLNPAAEILIGRTSPELLGQPIEQCLPELRSIHITRLTEPVRDRVVNIHGQMMDVSVYPLTDADTSSIGEYLLMAKTMEEVEKRYTQTRRQIVSKGFTARHTFQDIKTQNPVMIQLKQTAARMANSSSSIVIYGQSGTGKELFAQSIHNASSRRRNPFIAINCASIPEHLLESELFGYSEGAFTGAKKGGKPGYFELANRGTLFLDEIGELDMSLQARILRVLQEKEVTRVGGDSVISVDVRILSASNKRLRELVRQNLFREDLYYRLNVLSLEIPPLRERCEDIPLLITSIQEEIQRKVILSQEAVDYLKSYPWNGNVRELRNFVERLSYIEEPVISLETALTQLDDAVMLPHIPKDPKIQRFIEMEADALNRHRQILLLLAENETLGIHQGRAGIGQSLSAKGMVLSEAQVRSSLQTLRRYGFIQIHAGRKGTSLSPQGYHLLKELAANQIE